MASIEVEIQKKEIVIVWLKRDLRFTDHEPLFYAQKQALPILLVYCFEPTIMQFDDSDVRHWRFVYQSLTDMQIKLESLDSKIAIFHNEALFVLSEIANHNAIKTLFSHQEIGNKLTYDRDIIIHDFCKNNQIEWQEYQHNGIVRKLKSRKVWESLWKEKMEAQAALIDDVNCNFLKLDEELYNRLKGEPLAK